MPRHEGSARMMQLFVKLSDGRTRGFVVGRNSPLRRVKEQLALTEGVPIEEQRLLWAGRHCADDATADTAEMHSGATIHFAQRLRGGIFVETLELLWSFVKTVLNVIRELWNFLFGRCCHGKCHCKTVRARRFLSQGFPCLTSPWRLAQEEEEEDEDSDASSYDDFSSSGSDDDEEKQRRKEERQKRKAARAMEWGPVWNPPKQPPPLPPKEEKARRVFVGNVPPGLTEEAVRKCFGDFGAIDAVEIHSDHAFVCV